MTYERFEPNRAARVQIEESVLARLKSSVGFDLKRERLTRTDLRRLLAEGIAAGGPDNLLDLSLAREACARIFREPRSGDWGTVSRRLQTFREFLEVMLGKEEADRRMATIEERLIPRRTRDWDEVDRVGGGRLQRSSRAPRLLFFDDALRIVTEAGKGKDAAHAQRDIALVSLLCFSPLRWQEIVSLSWENLEWTEPSDASPFGAWYTCRRRDLELHLPIHRRASDALGVLYAIGKRVMDREPRGPVFRSLRHPYPELQYGDAKAVADDALALAGWTGITRVDLLAGYAYHLKSTYGFTYPDLKELLGYGEVKQVRHLLQSHKNWELNRKVDDMGGPIPEWAL